MRVIPEQEVYLPIKDMWVESERGLENCFITTGSSINCFNIEVTPPKKGGAGDIPPRIKSFTEDGICGYIWTVYHGVVPLTVAV